MKFWRTKPNRWEDVLKVMSVTEELNLLSFLSTNNTKVESTSIKRSNVKAMGKAKMKNALQRSFPLSALQLEELKHKELKWLDQDWPRSHVRARNRAWLSHVYRMLATQPPRVKYSGPLFPVHLWDCTDICTLPCRCPFLPINEILHHRVTWI